MPRLGLRLTPHGRLSVEDHDDGPDIDAAASIRLIDAFARGTGYGLVWLGAAEVGQVLPPLFVWWRDFAALYVGSLCLHASGLEAGERVKPPSIPAPTAAELSSLVLTAPIMAGAEYLTEDVLLALWDEMERAFAASLAAAKVGLQAFLTTLNRAWNLVGRVNFNLAENRRDPDQPFAFMATYTTRLSAQAKAQHVPLGQALREYAGAANRDKLLSLLLPVQRAAEHCAWLKPMIDAGDIFHPLRWVNAGPWLEQTLKELRAPDGDGGDPGLALRGTLRPYQKAGTRWMHLLAGLGLGAAASAAVSAHTGDGRLPRLPVRAIWRRHLAGDREPIAIGVGQVRPLAFYQLSSYGLRMKQPHPGNGTAVAWPRRRATAYSQERPTMSTTCQNPSIEAIGTAPLWSWPAYLFQGNPVTATFLKIKAFLYAFKTKSTQPTPGPGNQEDPPQSAERDDCWAEREDYLNDPMLWMLIFH